MCTVQFISLLVFTILLFNAGTNSQRENPIREALFLGNTSINNNTLDDCIWRRGNDKDSCPDPEVRVLLYTGSGPEGAETREVLDTSQADWLRNSAWNPNNDNVMLIHGYAGGEDTLPIVVLKDAYVRNGSYNVFFVDWGVLSQPPCYPSAVHNMRPIARCVADAFTFLRASGVPVDRTTCVGHSLGAHICGIMANYLLFRMHRIIGLDPARPLVRAGYSNRLDPGDAISVQVVHTNAGHYGEIGRVGHVDFCINGGKMQPYCENTPNENLCSHVWVICYMAESISGTLSKDAEPCSRRCPTGPRPGHRLGIPIALGQHTPMTASGSYCVADNLPPFCPENKGLPGDKRCCLSFYNATNNVT